MVSAKVNYGWYSYWSGAVLWTRATVKLGEVEDLKELEGLMKLDEPDELEEQHEGLMYQLLV